MYIFNTNNQSVYHTQNINHQQADYQTKNSKQLFLSFFLTQKTLPKWKGFYHIEKDRMELADFIFLHLSVQRGQSYSQQAGSLRFISPGKFKHLDDVLFFYGFHAH